MDLQPYLHSELLHSCSEKGMWSTLKTDVNLQFKLISTARNHSDGERFINLRRCLSEVSDLWIVEKLFLFQVYLIVFFLKYVSMFNGLTSGL